MDEASRVGQDRRGGGWDGMKVRERLDDSLRGSSSVFFNVQSAARTRHFTHAMPVVLFSSDIRRCNHVAVQAEARADRRHVEP